MAGALTAGGASGTGGSRMFHSHSARSIGIGMLRSVLAENIASPRAGAAFAVSAGCGTVTGGRRGTGTIAAPAPGTTERGGTLATALTTPFGGD